MKRTVIYRVQDKDGRGPFKPDFSSKWATWREDLKNLMPWFTELGPIHLGAFSWEEVGCGCRTIKQLRRWFTEKEYKILQQYGYEAIELKAVRILGESKTQILFTKKEPLNINTRPIDLYPNHLH